MPSRRVAAELNTGTYYLTLTVQRWYYLFDRYNRWQIMSDSLLSWKPTSISPPTSTCSMTPSAKSSKKAAP